jgi:hypothetical protein
MLTAENDFGELEDYFVLSGASAKRRSEGFGGGTRISRGGVVDAFRRDLQLMEVIAAAEDAVVNARVDLEEAEDRLARAFSLRQPSRAALLPILPLLAARFPRSVRPLAGRVFSVWFFLCTQRGIST